MARGGSRDCWHVSRGKVRCSPFRCPLFICHCSQRSDGQQRGRESLEMKTEGQATLTGFAARRIPQKASKRQEPEDDPLWTKGSHGHRSPKSIHRMRLRVEKPSHCRLPSREIQYSYECSTEEVRDAKDGRRMQRTGKVAHRMHQTQRLTR